MNLQITTAYWIADQFEFGLLCNKIYYKIQNNVEIKSTRIFTIIRLLYFETIYKHNIICKGLHGFLITIEINIIILYQFGILIKQ